MNWKPWLAFAGALALPTAAQAAAPPFPDKTVTITARGQTVDAVLTDLFGQAGLAVKISSSASAKMHGTFTGTPRAIWTQLARAFNLVAYWDGAVVRIYSSREIQSRTFAAVSPEGVVRAAQRLRLADGSNRVVASGGSVAATGVPKFLESVAELAASTPAPAVAGPSPVTPVTASVSSGMPIISPMLGPASRATVRSQLVRAASERDPYEVRIFYLRYARADDTIQKSFDRTIVIPGVATVLRGVMGDGRPSSTVSTSGNYEAVRLSQPRLLGRGQGAVAPDPSQRDYDDGDVRDSGSKAIVVTGQRDMNGPRVEVEPTNNAVIVRDRPESMRVYEDIVAALDIEQQVVEIEATILELDVSRLKDLGAEFSFQGSGLNLLFGGQASNPTASFSQPNLSGSYVTGSLDAFGLRITALEKNGALRVVSKPRLSTLNNVPAVYNDQVQYYVRVAGDRQVDLFPVTSGMVLRVNPSVLSDGGELRTRLVIEVVDGSLTGLVVDGLPAVKQSSINTQAVIKQGESLLIGGMTVDRQFDFKSKVPIAGDVPVIGQLFRKRSKGTQRVERLILITPRILSQATPTRAAAVEPIPLERLESLGRRGKGQRRP